MELNMANQQHSCTDVQAFEHKCSLVSRHIDTKGNSAQNYDATEIFETCETNKADQLWNNQPHKSSNYTCN